MKNRKKNQKDSHSRSKADGSLVQCVKGFLEAKSDDFALPTRQAYEYNLGRFVELCGDIPIAQVTIDQVRQFVKDPAISARSQNHRLVLLKGFLRWCHSQDCISDELYQAALAMRVDVSPPLPEILTPDQLKSLLSGTTDVELLVFIALSAFAGLRVGELQPLQWHDIKSGTGIHIGREVTMCGGRVIQMHPTLGAWLRPFYGTEGRVVPSRRIQARLYNLGKQLKIAVPQRVFRHSYCSYYLALVADVSRVAREAAYAPYHLKSIFTARVSAEDAKRFFSLTPEDVGLKDWPKLVAKYLERR